MNNIVIHFFLNYILVGTVASATASLILVLSGFVPDQDRGIGAYVFLYIGSFLTFVISVSTNICFIVSSSLAYAMRRLNCSMRTSCVVCSIVGSICGAIGIVSMIGEDAIKDSGCYELWVLVGIASGFLSGLASGMFWHVIDGFKKKILPAAPLIEHRQVNP